MLVVAPFSVSGMYKTIELTKLKLEGSSYPVLIDDLSVASNHILPMCDIALMVVGKIQYK